MGDKSTSDNIARALFEALEPRLLLNGTISGQLWEDLNVNWTHDAGEDGLNGRTIELVDLDTDLVVATQVTGSEDLDGNGAIDPQTEMGLYSFAGMPLGTYFVRQVVPAGWAATFPGVNPPSPDVAFHTVLAPVQQEYYTDPFTMAQVWDDNYWADLQPAPWVWKMNDDYYNDVWVHERDSSGFNPDALVPYTPGADPNTYWFIIGDSWPGGYGGGVEDDFYDLDVKIVESPTTGEVFVTAYQGVSIATYYIVGPDGTERPGPASNGGSVSLTFVMPRMVPPGESASDVDFGSVETGTVSGQKFKDTNANGQRDPGEPGLDGWTIKLLNVDTGVIDATAVTASVDLNGNGLIEPELEAGLYEFTSILPGTYYVSEGYQDYWSQTVWPMSFIVMTPGADVGNMDFGNMPMTAKVSGQLFEDIDGDGEHDATEPGLDDWWVRATQLSDGREVAWAATKSIDLDGDGVIDPATESGLYVLEHLPVGAVEVRLETKSPWVLTSLAGAHYTVTLAADQTLTGLDYGVGVLSMIRGQVFNDLDADGEQDPGEFGINGWAVEAAEASLWQVVATATTHGADLNGDGVIDPQTEAGYYGFTDLWPVHDYGIRVTSPPNWDQIAPMSDPVPTLLVVRGDEDSMTIYTVNPADGSVLSSFPAPTPAGLAGVQGLALGSGGLFYLDGGDPTAAPVLWELGPETGAVIDSDPVPGSPPVAAMGLAWLDDKVYVQRQADEIVVFDPVTDTVIDTIAVAGNIMGGLAAVDDLGLLFACNAAGEVLAIDPATGAIVNTFALATASLAGGLAYVNGELIAAPALIAPTNAGYRIDPLTGAVIGTAWIGGSGKVGGLSRGYTVPPAPTWHMVHSESNIVTGVQYPFRSTSAAGDMNGDGSMDADDIDLLYANFAGPRHVGPQYDLDGDGDADNDDMDILVHNLVETTVGVGTEYGDANLDGEVSSTDLAILAANFGMTAKWSQGDVSGSGAVDTTDLAILAANFGFVAGPPTLSTGRWLPADQLPEAPAHAGDDASGPMSPVPLSVSASVSLGDSATPRAKLAGRHGQAEGDVDVIVAAVTDASAVRAGTIPPGRARAADGPADMLATSAARPIARRTRAARRRLTRRAHRTDANTSFAATVPLRLSRSRPTPNELELNLVNVLDEAELVELL